MRESIGTSFMLNFIILFIFLVFAFLAGTFSYYKAYRINNYIVNAIEKYEGYNEYSRAEIAKGLSALGYDITTKIGCPETWENSSQVYYASDNGVKTFTITGRRVFVDGDDEGYCVYLYWNDDSAISYGSNDVLETTDVYYSYGVLTYIRLRFPVVEYVLRIPIFSRTNRMYYFG